MAGRYTRLPTAEVADDDDHGMTTTAGDGGSSASTIATVASSSPASSLPPTAAPPAPSPSTRSILQSVYEYVVGGGNDAGTTPAERARVFLRMLRSIAGPGGGAPPAFMEASFGEAVAASERECRPLLVFLHSPLHEDAVRFVRETVTSPDFTSYVNGRFVLWGGSTATAEGYEACAKFGAAAFPFLGVFMPARGSTPARPKFTRVWSHVGGFMAPAAVVMALTTSCAAALTTLEVMQAERASREFERRLRQEQEEDYRAAEEEDLRRAAQAEAAERLAAAEEARRAEEEARKAEGDELAAAIELSKTLHHESDLAAAQRRLVDAPEPAAGDKGVHTLRFTLPNGTRFQRRFKTTDTLQTVRDVVMVITAEMGTGLHHFDLSSQYPKRTYPAVGGDNTVTLSSIGVGAQVMFFVTQTTDQADADAREVANAASGGAGGGAAAS